MTANDLKNIPADYSENEIRKALLNVLEDIETERNNTRALAEELKKFRLAVDQATDAIIITDAAGRIIYSNKSGSVVTGYSADEMLNRKPGELWGGKASDEFYQKMWQTIHRDKQPFKGEVINHRKNGQEFVAELEVTPILNDQGEVRFFVSFERDITQAKEIDRVKTEFVSVSAHQLKAPLTSIKWYLDLLNDQQDNLTKDQHDFLQQINDSTSRMIRMINDFLNISRMESGTKFAIDRIEHDFYASVTQAVKEQKAEAAQKKIILDWQPPAGQLSVVFDEEKIRSVIQNLVNNAIKYSTDGKTISIKTALDGGQVVLSVTDQGIGIPKEQQQKVFGKFFRADNALKQSPEGTGLGLYIAKAIVEGHGGRIWFESKEGTGSTFSFSLPLPEKTKKGKS